MRIRQAMTSDEAALREGFEESDFEERLASGQLLLFEGDDLGVLAYAIVDRTFFGRPFVQRLFVHAGHRRQGIGSRLLAAAVEREGSRRVFTSTNLSNASMHQLLLAAGWQACGLVHGLDEGDPEVFYFCDQS